MDNPKYSIGTLVLSNVPYTHGDLRRDRELGIIIHIYERALPFTRTSIYMYVVEWNGPDRRTPVAYTVEDIDCFVNNLNSSLKK